ncbi:MAG: GntR family transcriptional regulator [Lachnospiraceae bacterium]|nr:GntR family transcriptional regulator [Lachnospiraceae bacterium]
MILLDYRDKRPIYEQVVEKLERLIVGGGLKANTKMPSVRALALELAVNPNTIQRAYAQLEQEGYLYTVSGRGSFVAHESEWRGAKEAELVKNLQAAVHEAKEAGMERERLEAIIAQAYGPKPGEAGRIGDSTESAGPDSVKAGEQKAVSGDSEEENTDD